MASISQIKVGSTSYAVTVPFLTCSTAASTKAKTAEFTGFSSSDFE